MLYAKSLFLRGFANVHLLKGSVKEFAQAYPDLVEGNKAEIITKEASTLCLPVEERLSAIHKNSLNPSKRIKQTKAELLEELNPVKPQNEKKKPVMASKNTRFEREDRSVSSMPKLVQKKQMLQRIPSSNKRVPEDYPLANYAGIPVKPVKIVNAH